jgi:hypothetical protein
MRNEGAKNAGVQTELSNLEMHNMAQEWLSEIFLNIVLKRPEYVSGLFDRIKPVEGL